MKPIEQRAITSLQPMDVYTRGIEQVTITNATVVLNFSEARDKETETNQWLVSSDRVKELLKC